MIIIEQESEFFTNLWNGFQMGVMGFHFNQSDLDDW